MQTADIMAFPFSPQQLMEGTGKFRVHPAVREIDFLHMTSVPPNKTSMVDILKAHDWFQGILGDNKLSGKVVCGLQHPPLDGNESDMRNLYSVGIRVVTLAYQGENIFGGGFAAPNVPLTQEGKEFLGRMHDAGIVLDLSHAGHQTARDALKYFAKFNTKHLRPRIVATHSACHAVYPHPRNLPDDILKCIARKEGLIGLPTVTWMLHGSDNTLDPFFRHLDYLINLVGVEHICIGSDGGYYKPLIKKEEQELHDKMTATFDPTGTVFRARLPSEAKEIHNPGRLFILAELIAARYKSSRHAELIIGENLCAYAKRIFE